MSSMFRAYFPAGALGHVWKDLLVTPKDVLSRTAVEARYILVDVGLSMVIKAFGDVEYPRFWLDKYFNIVRGLMDYKPGHVWAIVPDCPPKWSGREIEHYFSRHWRLFFKLYEELDGRFMPVIRYEGLGIWELDMLLKNLKPYLQDFEALGLPSRPGAGLNELWMARVWKVREVFPDHWLHGLGAGFRRIKFLSPGLLNSIDFASTFTDMAILKSMAKTHLGIEICHDGGSKKFTPKICDYKGLSKALLEVFLKLLEEKVGRIDYAWRQD